MQGAAYLGGLWPPMADAVRYLSAWCDYLSYDLRIVSGWRSGQEQAQLYAIGRTPQEIANHVSKRGAGGSVTDAVPGTSAHNYGLAVDLDGPDMMRVRALAQQIGFATVDWDMPHLEWPNWRHLVGLP